MIVDRRNNDTPQPLRIFPVSRSVQILNPVSGLDLENRAEPSHEGLQETY